MKVDKKFAPINILVEHQEELEFLLKVLTEAEHGYMASGKAFCSPRKYTDSFMQKLNYFHGQLK